MSLTPLPDVGHIEHSSILRTRRVFASLARPAPALTMAGCVLLMLACNVNAVLGPHAVAFKIHYAHWFMLSVLVFGSYKLYGMPTAIRVAAASSAARILPWFLAFGVLIGVHGLVSNGLDYQQMASDYWNTDPFASTSRRLGMPVLAHVLGFEQKFYALFWYGIVFATFWAAMHLLVSRRLSVFEALSVLTSSILAYALEGPGYSEIAVFLLGLGALRFKLALTDKIVVAALMIATHETATPFVALTVILAGDVEDQQEWLVVFGLLYLAFVASYVMTWHNDLAAALLRAGKPSPTAEQTSPELVRHHPGLAALGAFLAYKLYWLPVLAALRRSHLRIMASLTLASLALVLAGSDTSRLVQFSSLSLFLIASSELNYWPRSARRLLATTNLLVPSVYVATNAGLLWGPGLYALYLRGAAALDIPLGRVFWQ